MSGKGADTAVDVVTLGEAMGVVASGVGERLSHAATARLDICGAEANVAVGLARLGHRAAFVGRVGDDAFGVRIRSTLAGEGVDVSRVVTDPAAPTGLLVKELRVGTLAKVAYYRAGSAGSRLTPDDVPFDAIAAARVLHVTGITAALSASAREAVSSAVDAARAAGVTVSFDVNFRARLWPDRDEASATFTKLAAAADLVIASEDELPLIEPALPGTGHLVVTRGSRGAAVTLDGVTHEAPAVPVTALDTVGAGDAFVAGYLSALLDGLPPEECLRRGAVTGAFAAASVSDWQGAPTRDELGLLARGGDVTLR